MLVDVTFIDQNEESDVTFILNMIAKVNSNITETIRHQTGIYQIGHWNSEHMFTEKIINSWDMPDLLDENEEYISSYGVCDNYQQLLSKCPMLEKNPRKFAIFMVSIKKENQSPEGGWRWHKWGPYIGNQNCQCEYLYDEPEIDEVFTYHIHELV